MEIIGPSGPGQAGPIQGWLLLLLLSLLMMLVLFFAVVAVLVVAVVVVVVVAVVVAACVVVVAVVVATTITQNNNSDNNNKNNSNNFNNKHKNTQPSKICEPEFLCLIYGLRCRLKHSEFRVYRDCSVWCFTVRHHPVHSKATHCYGYRATCY